LVATEPDLSGNSKNATNSTGTPAAFDFGPPVNTLTPLRQFALPFSDIAASMGWFAPLGLPVRTRVLPTSEHPALALGLSDAARDNRWFSALAEPVRRRGLAPGSNPYLSFVKAAPFAESVSIDKWQQPLSEPKRFPKVGTTFEQPYAYFVKAAPFPETVSADRWQQPLSEPVRRRGYPTQAQDELSFVGSDVATDAARWFFYPLSEPSRRRGYSTSAQDELSFVGSDIATDTRWFAPLSEPTRAKKLTDFPSLSWSYLTPTAGETVTVDKYYNWLAEPVRARSGLPAYDQQVLAFVKADPFPEAISIDRWLRPLSEPKRFPAALSGAAQPYLAFVEAAPFAEAVSIDKWLLPLGEPTRRIRFAEYPPWFPAAYYFPANPDITVEKWYAALREPTRLRLLPTGEQPFFAFVKAAPFAEAVSVDRWQQALSEPSRRKQGAQLYVRFPFVGTDTATDARWFSPLSIPTRRKPTAVQPDGLIWSKFTPAGELITLDKWFAALREPVLPRRGLPTREQPFLSFVKAAPFAETTFITKWFQPLSLPTRRKVSFVLYPALSFVKAPPFGAATPPVFSGLTFPPFLQADFLVSGYSNKRDAAAVRSAMESGFDRVRLTNRSPLRIVSGVIDFTQYQAEFFNAWYDYSAKNGEIWFHIDIPIESVKRTVLARFVGEQALAPISTVADRWRLTTRLEINDANLLSRSDFTGLDDGVFPAEVLENAIQVDNYSNKRAAAGNRTEASNEGIANFRAGTLTPFRLFSVSWQWDDTQLAYFNEWLEYRARNEAAFFSIDVPIDSSQYRTVKARFSSPPVVNAINFNRWQVVAELEARDVNSVTPSQLAELEALFAEATPDELLAMIGLIEDLTLDPFFDAWDFLGPALLDEGGAFLLLEDGTPLELDS
jgi:hypothetical protein